PADALAEQFGGQGRAPLRLVGPQRGGAQRRLPVEPGGLPGRPAVCVQPLGEAPPGVRHTPDDTGPPGSHSRTIMTTRMVLGYRWQNCRVRTDEDRERLRQTFDAAAARDDRVRPEYPEALFGDLVALAGLRSGDELLEVGCATGKATRPLARRGFRITCVELGAELGVVARQNLAGFGVEVVRASFEEWRAPHPF